MDLTAFLTSGITRAYIDEAIRADLTTTQQGNRAATYFPRVLQDVTEINRRIVSMRPPIIAADVAPLSTGRQGGGMQKQEVRGNLIDSAARYEYQGRDIEDLRALRAIIDAVPGDAVNLSDGASNRALETFFSFMSVHVLEPLYMNMNRKDWTLLRTGKAWNDGTRDDDFTHPALISLFAAQQITAIAPGNAKNIYNGSAPDFFMDYQDAVTRAQTRGWKIREAVMNSNTRRQILSLASTRTATGGMALNVVTGGSVEVQMTQSNATVEAFNSALAARDLPPVVVEDGKWTDQVRAAGDPAGAVGEYVSGAYLPDGVVIFVPESRPEERAFVENEVLLSGLPIAVDGTAKGIHLIGRPTAQDEGAKVYLFGPYYERSENPRLWGSGILAHMPFLAGPAGFEVLEYIKP